MGSIWENSQWPEEIYRLQINDPIQGGQDGVTNVPPTQVANRTRWLLDTFGKEHNEDGTHSLYNDSFAPDAALAENKLVLDYSTAGLKEQAAATVAAAGQLRADLDSVLGSDGFYLQGLARLAQLDWRYADFGFEFEFFCDEISMRDLANVNTRGAIAKDDSLDVENTVGITPGMRLLLSDGTQSEEVEIWKLLEHGRIRLTSDLKNTYADGAQLGYTDWSLSRGRAVALRNQVYYSRVTSVLAGAPVGKLIICRDDGDGLLNVAYRVSGVFNDWRSVDCSAVHEASHYPGYFYEEYELEGGEIQLRITATNSKVEVLHLALFPAPTEQIVSSIRTPKVLLPKEGSEVVRTHVQFQASGFFTAYKDYYVCTEYRLVSTENDETVATFQYPNIEKTAEVDEDKIPVSGLYNVSCRHKSDIGEWSAWSAAVTVTIKDLRAIFGFVGTPGARGFNDGPLASLGDDEVRFGFVGAENTAGFGLAPFVFPPTA